MTDEEYRRADWCLAKAQAAPHALTEWESGFVDDMTDRLESQGRNMRLSDRQWEILEAIAGKAA